MKIRVFSVLLFLISSACFSQNSDNSKFFAAQVGNIGIDIPDGFEVIQNQHGYIHKGSASTLFITEMEKVPFSFAGQHFNNENFEKGNAKIISTQKVKTQDGNDAVLYTLTLNITAKEGNKTIEYERLILITGNESTTVFVVANYPVMVKKIIEEPLKASLLSVKLKSKD